MYELSLFSGAGGGLLASHYLIGWRTILYCELDPYAREVLHARIREGHLDDAPIFDDVRSLNTRVLAPYRDLARRAPVVVTAGFPCQPFSVAGKRQAADDERNLWPETSRVLREVRPRYALLENVPGLLAESHGYFGTILQDLAESGFDAEWGVLGAGDVGGPHRRKRLWIRATLADADRPRLSKQRRGRSDWPTYSAPKRSSGGRALPSLG